MNKTILFDFLVDKENNKITVDRSFNAPIDLVWAAWTEAEILDQWWAPKPWQTRTKTMDFKEGGHWLYAMLGPNNEEHWVKVDFITINHQKSFTTYDGFCNSDGVLNTEMPRNKWENSFSSQADSTLVNIVLTFDSLSDLEKILEMGFKEGFTAGLENLDQYINAQFYLRKQNKPDNNVRVSAYLNFPGNTEEAFGFYKSVFKTEFVNGIHRFGDIPPDANHPPLAENVKKMVLHIELPLIGGHILMGSDAPEEMGFTVTRGNNMHINLEPDSREEAERIFNELSVEGDISMPLQDMFWGAYFGSFTDKYGINWMINFQQPN